MFGRFTDRTRRVVVLAGEEEAGSAAGRRTAARELDRLTAELERLRAALREHGIEPGEAG